MCKYIRVLIASVRGFRIKSSGLDDSGDQLLRELQLSDGLVFGSHDRPARLQEPIPEYFPEHPVFLAPGLWFRAVCVVHPKQLGRKSDALDGHGKPFAAVEIEDP